MPYQRHIVEVIKKRINEPRRFMQIVIGPRQTGKTTAVNQVLSSLTFPYISVEATRGESDSAWIRAQWYRARNLLKTESSVLLVIDEIQYIKNWSAVVKTLWDEDTASGSDIRVLFTGSSYTLIQAGLNESLVGRFELIECPHWTFSECIDAFGYSLDDFLYFGGYPGAEPLREDQNRWVRYMKTSVIEPSILNDALTLGDVRKPELMRRLFAIGAPYSAQEISYRKLLGQLDDRGNVTTLAHYLELLSDAGIMSGLHKYDPKFLREKSSSPRLLVHDTSLMVATYGRKRKSLLSDPELRGRLVESAVGAYLINRAYSRDIDVYWWREGDKEVDFVITCEDALTAIEVKSGRVKSTKGLDEFILRYPHAHALIVGSPECTLEDFLLGNVELFR